MQPWTSNGSCRLFCAFQASLRPFARQFTTTPALERANRFKKAQWLEERRAKKDETRGIKGKKDVSNTQKTIREKVVGNDFHVVVAAALKEVQGKQDSSETTPEGLEQWTRFERFVINACKMEDRRGAGKKPGNLRHIKTTLQKAYINNGTRGLKSELEFSLYAHNVNAEFSEPNLERQEKIADLRHPAEWYPQARATQRTIHLHVGPTNSGKTYHALQRLREAKSGFYAGPLRLLAQEVYHRFQSGGIPCSLVTGDDVKSPEGQKPVIVSNTVEMVNLGRSYEVGVIDEIQMIADSRRGWAWTRALLGSRATELHLCGEVRTVPLIQELAALTGDKLEIHRYSRLNPLKVMDKSFGGDISKIEKGDCLVSFSRVGIHAWKETIERTTGRRAAIVYGGLPAEIRTQQANLFNDPDNDYDFLVASDAIGMGLNLSCKRIIFETLVKRVPEGFVRLTVPEIKQIGGRAGRYQSASQQTSDVKRRKNEESNIGYVTSLEDVDLPYIRQALGVEPPPIAAAGIAPTDSVYEKIAAYFPQNVSMEYILKRLTELCQVSPLFFMCDPRNSLENAQVIDAVHGLQLADQLTVMAAPLHAREAESREVAMSFARCIAKNTNGRLLDIPDLNLEILEEPVSGNKGYMAELESLHKSVILYSWLSYRFGGIFTDRTLAFHVKELVEERMVRALTEFSANKKLRKDASLHRQIALQKQILERQQLYDEADESDEFTTSDGKDSAGVDLMDHGRYEEQPAESDQRAEAYPN